MRCKLIVSWWLGAYFFIGGIGLFKKPIYLFLCFFLLTYVLNVKIWRKEKMPAFFALCFLISDLFLVYLPTYSQLNTIHVFSTWKITNLNLKSVEINSRIDWMSEEICIKSIHFWLVLNCRFWDYMSEKTNSKPIMGLSDNPSPLKTSLLHRLQAQTLPDANPPIG